MNWRKWGSEELTPPIARSSKAASVHVQTAAVVAGKPTGVCGHANFVSGHGGGVCMPESAVTSLSLSVESVGGVPFVMHTSSKTNAGTGRSL